MERELLLLGLLRQHTMHGYQLHELIDRALASCTDLKKSTAYFLLEKMEKAGWVTQTQTQAGKRPPRRVYQLTTHGEAEFQRLLRANLSAHTPVRFADDIGLAFLDALKSEEALALLAHRLTALTAELAAARAAPPHEGRLQLLIEHQRRHLAAEVAWLESVIAHLQPSPASPPPAAPVARKTRRA